MDGHVSKHVGVCLDELIEGHVDEVEARVDHRQLLWILLDQRWTWVLRLLSEITVHDLLLEVQRIDLLKDEVLD